MRLRLGLLVASCLVLVSVSSPVSSSAQQIPAQQSLGFTLFNLANTGSTDTLGNVISNPATPYSTDGKNVVFSNTPFISGAPNCSSLWSIYTTPIYGGAITPLVLPATKVETLEPSGTVAALCKNSILAGSNVVYGADYTPSGGTRRYGFFKIPFAGGTSADVLANSDTVNGVGVPYDVVSGASGINSTPLQVASSALGSQGSFAILFNGPVGANVPNSGALFKNVYDAAGAVTTTIASNAICGNYQLSPTTPSVFTSDGNGLYAGITSYFSSQPLFGNDHTVLTVTNSATAANACSSIAYDPSPALGGVIPLPGIPIPTTAGVTYLTPSFGQPIVVGNSVYFAASQTYSDSSYSFTGIFVYNSATAQVSNFIPNLNVLPGIDTTRVPCSSSTSTTPRVNFAIVGSSNYLVLDVYQVLQDCTTKALTYAGGIYVYNFSQKSFSLAVPQSAAYASSAYGWALGGPQSLSSDGHLLIGQPLSIDPTTFATTSASLYSVNLNQVVTALALSAPAVSAYGAPVTLTAKVLPNTGATSLASGNVAFYDGTTRIGLAAIDSTGTATFTTSTLASTSHTFYASYGGDTLYEGAISATATLVIGKGAVSGSATPVAGAKIALNAPFTVGATFPATIGGTPTGPVNLYVDGYGLGALGLTATQSVTLAYPLSTQPLAPGPHTVMAVYAGDANFAGATVSNVFYVQAPTSVTATGAAAVYGTASTPALSVALYGGTTATPTGTISYNLDSGAKTGTATLTGGQLGTSVALGNLTAGTHSLALTYAGDNYYQPATATVPFTVSQAPLTLTAVSASRAYGANNPAITTQISGLVNGDANPAGSPTTVATITSPVGTYPIVPTTSGPTPNYTVTLVNGTLTITQAATTGTVTSSASSVASGAPVTLTATLVSSTSGTPTGSVGFFTAGTTSLGSATLVNGVATLTTSALPGGIDSVTAGYLGDTNFSRSTSPAATVTVTVASGVSAASPSGIVYGQAAPVLIKTAQPVGGAVPTGTILYTVDGGTQQTATLTSGAATLSLTGLAAGTHTVVASYSGDTLYTAASIPVAGFSLAQAPLTVTGANATRIYGAPNPTLTATVSGAVNGDVLTTGATTVATTTSAAGTYPIVPTAAGAAIANYAVTPVSGTLTVTKAGSATALTASAASVAVGTSVTFTATTTSATTGVPTGTVTFMNGQTVLGTGTLNGSGVATYATSTLAVGTASVTAVYAGDTNFNGATSTAAAVIVGTPDYTVTATPASATINAGQTATFVFTVTPVFGFTQPVSFACSGLPVNATCTFAPTTITPNGSPATTTLTIATSVKTADLRRGPLGLEGRSGMALAAMLMLLPLGSGRIRRRVRGATLAAVLLLAAGLAGISGCGGGSASTATITPDGTTTISATASAGSGGGSHAVSIALTVVN